MRYCKAILLMRSKRLFILFFCLFSFSIIFINKVYSQDKYYTKTGNINFISRTAIIDIAGYNKEVISYFNIKTGDIVFGVIIRSFKFPLPLAEEHFNENYMETDIYPDAGFRGKVLDIKNIDFTRQGTYDVEVEGNLKIHGITKNIKVKGKISILDNKIKATSEFKIAPEDFKIRIPVLVTDKVAKEVDTYIDMMYLPYNKVKSEK
jgi:hypothetical protein